MELKLKYLLIIILLSTYSLASSKDGIINIKSVKEMFKDRNPSLKFEYNYFFNFSVGDESPMNTLTELSKKLENDDDYIVIKKGSFRMIKDKTNDHVYFGNHHIVIEAENQWIWQSVHLLIDKPIKGKENVLVPDDFGCRDWNVLDWIQRNDFEEYNYLPLIKLNDDDFNKTKHNLFTIPYFNSKPNTVVVALGESGNHAGGHRYILFDTNTHEYAILGPFKDCGSFPDTLISKEHKRIKIFLKIKEIFN